MLLDTPSHIPPPDEDEDKKGKKSNKDKKVIKGGNFIESLVEHLKNAER